MPITAIITAYFLKLAPFILIGIFIFIFLTFAIFKNPCFGLFIVAFLLPFERLGSFELFGTTIRASQIFALITLVAWLFTFLAKKINFDAKNPLLIPIFLFSGFSIFSMINAQNLQRGILVFLFNSFVIAISLAIPNLIKSKNSLDRVIKIILISCLVVSLFGIYQFIGDMLGLPHDITGLREHYTKQVFGFPRVHSTALEPLYFANYLLIPISLCFALLLSERKENKKIISSTFWLVVILGFAVLNLILTLSRGGFLGLGTTLLLIGIFYLKSILSLKKIVILGLIVISAFSATYGFLLISGKKKNIDVFLKQATTYSKGVGVEERFTTYKEAWSMISEYPLLGGGVGNFGPYASRSPDFQPKEGWLIVNNQFLEIWAEEGIFGLISFLLLIFLLVLRSIKALILKNADSHLKTLLVGLLIAFIAVIVQYQTFSTLYILHIWVLIGLLVAVQNLIFILPRSKPRPIERLG
jgi:O-antigen ligase